MHANIFLYFPTGFFLCLAEARPNEKNEEISIRIENMWIVVNDAMMRNESIEHYVMARKIEN